MGIVTHCGDRRFHFVDDVGKAAVGMESEMPRAGTGRQRNPSRIVGRELARGRIEAEDENLVQPQICGEGKAVGRIDIDRVRVGTFLAPRIGPLPLS